MLPADVARCDGLPMRSECRDCLRRTDRTPSEERVWFATSPALVDGKCPMRLEGER